MPINKDWILGFIESSGCFSLTFSSQNTCKLKYQITPVFAITSKNLENLNRIKEFFGFGNVYAQKNSYIFRTKNLNEAKKIIKIFNENDFLSKKLDFAIWKKCIQLICNEEHLNKKGLLKILFLRELLHKNKKSWNKKQFCLIRKEVSPCIIYIKKRTIPKLCDLCFKKPKIYLKC